MEIAIAIVGGLVSLVGALLQLALVFEGLSVVYRFTIPFLSKERVGWFGLWGGWHLIMIGLLLKFAYDKHLTEMEEFRQVALQLEGLRILGMYLVLPLLVSFLISRAHFYVREHRLHTA